MTSDDALTSISQRYQRFAENEARGRSPLYEMCARVVTTDPTMLAFLATLPEPKRQPNLLFATARWLGGTPDSNEAARCATLLPVLAALPQPLALLEVGASAGLTLLPDRYSYNYAGQPKRTAPDPPAPVLRCQPYGPVPLPDGPAPGHLASGRRSQPPRRHR